MRRFLFNLPWYAMQIAIIGGVVYACHQGAKMSGQETRFELAFMVGVVFALIATGVVAKILDWLLILRVAVSRRIRKKHDVADESLSLPPNGARSHRLQQPPRLRIDQNFR